MVLAMTPSPCTVLWLVLHGWAESPVWHAQFLSYQLVVIKSIHKQSFFTTVKSALLHGRSMSLDRLHLQDVREPA